MSKERLEEIIMNLPYTVRYEGNVEALIEYAEDEDERLKELEEVITYMADVHFGNWDVNGLILRAKELNGGNGDGK